MMDKGPKQHPVDIWPTPFHNYDPLNDQLDNTGKSLVAFKNPNPHYIMLYTQFQKQTNQLH